MHAYKHIYVHVYVDTYVHTNKCTYILLLQKVKIKDVHNSYACVCDIQNFIGKVRMYVVYQTFFDM